MCAWLTFAITDGRGPATRNATRCCAASSAARCASAISISSCASRFSCKLVPVVVEQMGGAFPGVEGASPSKVRRRSCDEEAEFLQDDLERGIGTFEKAADEAR